MNILGALYELFLNFENIDKKWFYETYRKRSAATKQPYSEQSEPKQTKLSSEQIPETWIENKKPIFQHREKATFNEVWLKSRIYFRFIKQILD